MTYTKCPRCGALVPEGSRFCQECSLPLSQTQPVPAQFPVKKKNSAVTAAIVGTVVVVGGLGAKYGVSSSKDESSNAVSSSQSVSDVSSDITDNSSSNITESNEKDVEETEPISTYYIKGFELGEYGRPVTINEDTDLPETAYLYKLPAGTYKIRTENSDESADFAIIKDCISYDNYLPYPETFNSVEKFYLSPYGDTEIETTLNGDESFRIYSDKTLVFDLVSTSDEIVYYLLSGETGEYGRIITLNPDTDLPVEKYLYKLPAGEYTAITTFKKMATFFVVKDETTIEQGSAYPEILQYVSEGFMLTAGDDDFNGSAKKEAEFTLADDESVLIPDNFRGIELIIKPKE